MSTLSEMLKRLRAPPVRAHHVEPSFLLSLDDDPAVPDDFLFDLSLKAIDAARAVNLDDIAGRNPQTAHLIRCWPGEHYRLLAGMVQVLAPRTVVEIGTATGASALAMLKFLDAGAHLYTFDLVPWQQYGGHVLRDDDFRDGRLSQIIDDVTTDEGVRRHMEVLRAADLIFIDAAKDGSMEARLLRSFSKIAFLNRTVVVFDDIRLYNMLAIWRTIASPKIDLTSFGHFSGTGVTHAPVRLSEAKR